jgi:hypothetical protein
MAWYFHGGWTASFRLEGVAPNGKRDGSDMLKE